MKYYITEKDGRITASLPLALRDGRTLWIRASTTIEDTYRELGLDPAIYNMQEVGGFPGSLFKGIAKTVKKIAKSKVVRGVVNIGKKVLKSPITSVALGAITGGSALPALAAANVGIRLAEAATKGGKKGRTARKMLKHAKRHADRKQAKLRKARRIKHGLIRKGKLNPQYIANLQLRALRKKIARAKARRKAPTTARAADWLVNVHLK